MNQSIVYRQHLLSPSADGGYWLNKRREVRYPGRFALLGDWEATGQFVYTIADGKRAIDARIARIQGENPMVPSNTVDPIDSMMSDAEDGRTIQGTEANTAIVDEAERVMEQNDAYDAEGSPHPDAGLMAEYARDAAEMREPWRRWQARPADEPEWKWFDRKEPVDFNDLRLEYRRRPRFKHINGHDVPEPMRQYPEPGDTVFLVTLVAEEGGVQEVAVSPENREAMKRFVDRGILHETLKAAATHATALLSFPTE